MKEKNTSKYSTIITLTKSVWSCVVCFETAVFVFFLNLCLKPNVEFVLPFRDFFPLTHLKKIIHAIRVKSSFFYTKFIRQCFRTLRFSCGGAVVAVDTQDEQREGCSFNSGSGVCMFFSCLRRSL